MAELPVTNTAIRPLPAPGVQVMDSMQTIQAASRRGPAERAENGRSLVARRGPAAVSMRGREILTALNEIFDSLQKDAR